MDNLDLIHNYISGDKDALKLVIESFLNYVMKEGTETAVRI